MIYLVKREDGLIKIGTSKQFYSRLKQLEREYGKLQILAWQYGDREIEKSLHIRFVQDRVMLEWFNPSGELLKYIEENTVTSPPPMPVTTLSTETLVQTIEEQRLYIEKAMAWQKTVIEQHEERKRTDLRLIELAGEIAKKSNLKDLRIQELEAEIAELKANSKPKSKKSQSA